MSLFWRVFGLNAAIFVIAAVVLIASPATISSPVVLAEVGVLLAGLLALLLVNLLLVRVLLAPLARLTSRMRQVDLLAPAQRLEARGPEELRTLTAVFNEMLGRLERERRESGRRALAAQEAERKRVAQELHDEVGQAVTAVTLSLARAAKAAPPELRAELLEAQETARASLDDVRRIARELRPEALDDLGLTAALTALTAGLAERTGLEIDRRIDRELPPLDPEEELVIYRVAQESLTNVARHAGATRVELRLERAPDGVRLRVADDGSGLDGAAPGTGVRGMRERALLVGASVRVGPGAERGTVVDFLLPRR